MPAITVSEPLLANVNGITLCYQTFGDRQSPPIVLIMGLGAQMLGWDAEFCTLLAERGYFVVRFDNRDVGQSTKINAGGIPNIGAMMMASAQGKPLTAPYLLSDMANDTAALITTLGLAPAHIVGASMGGMIAQQLAVAHPTLVRTLTSIMSTTGDPSLPPAKPEAMAALMTPSPMDLDGFLVHFQKVWKALRGPGFPLDEARDLQRGKAVFERGLHPAGAARQTAAIIASGSRRASLRSITVPTLVIHGDADPLVTVEGGIDTAAAIRGAKLVRIPTMGHALPITLWPQIVEPILALVEGK